MRTSLRTSLEYEGPSKVALRRKEADQRGLENSEEIAAVLSGEGYEPVDIAQLSFVEQVRTFNRVPARVELSLELLAPLFGRMMRRVRGARREIGKERLLWRDRFAVAHPVDRLVGHVGHEMVALFGRLVRLHRDRVLE